MSFFSVRIHQNRPRPHWGSLQRSPDSIAGLKGPLRGRRGMEGRTRGGEGGKGGIGKGGKGGVGWNSTLVVGGIDTPS